MLQQHSTLAQTLKSALKRDQVLDGRGTHALLLLLYLLLLIDSVDEMNCAHAREAALFGLEYERKSAPSSDKL